jgi:hypothetical protein
MALPYPSGHRPWDRATISVQRMFAIARPSAYRKWHCYDHIRNLYSLRGRISPIAPESFCWGADCVQGLPSGCCPQSFCFRTDTFAEENSRVAAAGEFSQSSLMDLHLPRRRHRSDGQGRIVSFWCCQGLQILARTAIILLWGQLWFS